MRNITTDLGHRRKPMSKEKSAPKYNKLIANNKGEWVEIVLTDSELSRALRRSGSSGIDDSAKGRIVSGMNKNPIEIKGVKYYLVNAFTAGM